MASILMTITKVSRFATDAAGLEKTLRLLQGLSQIVITYTASSKDAAPWLQARKQFALGRRYLRFFKFVDAFTTASRGINSPSGTTAVLHVGKWSSLGLYLLLESCTLMDAMEIWSPAWAPRVLVEANKFWFYSLLFSLASCLLQLCSRWRSLVAPEAATSTARVNKPGPRPKANTTTTLLRRALVTQVLTDACDLLIPGSVTGWAMTSPAVVGWATVVSTLLASQEIWYRVQRGAAAAAAADGRAGGSESQARRKGKV